MDFTNIINKNKGEFEMVCRSLVGDDLNKLLEYLESTDYYYAPASRTYHDNYPGGLYDHSKRVYGELYELRKRMKKNWTDLELLIIAFGHDLCKIGMYLPKLNEDGTLTYVYPDGADWNHGTKSLRILSEVIPEHLNKRISESIVFHMGLWTVDVDNVGELMTKAQSDNDLVFFTHSADMVASRMGVVKVTKVENNIVNVYD